MIVRKDPAGSLTLIGQTDHSRFVGQLAAHWGNRDFAAPAPYDRSCVPRRITTTGGSNTRHDR